MPEQLKETTKEPKAAESGLSLEPSQPSVPSVVPDEGQAGGVYAYMRSVISSSGGQEPDPDQLSSFFRPRESSNSINSAQRSRALSLLQQQYGNRYVQRVLSSASPLHIQKVHERSVQGEVVQPSADNPPSIPAQLSPAIDSSSGYPLDAQTQAFMQSRFGHDFNGVRVHTDSKADQVSRSLNAEAFTTGRDIYFSRGAYDPSSSSGRGLIAHELTHVLQQQQGQVRPGVSHPDDPLEREADSVRQALGAGGTPSIGARQIQMPSIQRQAAKAEAARPKAETPGAAPTGAPVAAPVAPGDFPVAVAGYSIGIPVGRLIKRFKKDNQLVIPNLTKVVPVPIPWLQSLQASFDLDEADRPVGGQLMAGLAVPKLEGDITLRIDKAGAASGDFNVNAKIPGLRQTQIRGSVDSSKFSIEGDIGFDIPYVTGNLHYAYRNGKHSGKGQGNYQGAKFGGMIEIIVSEEGAVSGSGLLELELFKGLRGTVNVDIDEQRRVRVQGKLAVPGQIELFPEKKYEKSFFSFERKFPLWGFTIPVIDVNVGLFAEIHASAGFRAKFGPGVLRGIELTGEFGTDPEAATEFGLGGEFFVPAGAEVVLAVGGGVGLGLLIADITGGIEAIGVAGLYSALSVRPQFKYSGGKYTISGTAELAGVAQVKLGINAFAKVDVGVWIFKGTVWRRDWTLAEWIWNTGLNVALRANMSYTLGEDFAPDFSFETGQVDPEKLVRDVMPESGSPVPAPPKPPVPDKASFVAEGKAGAQVPEAAPGAAPAPPIPGTPPAKTTKGAQEGTPTGTAGSEAAPPTKVIEVSEGEEEVEETAPAAAGKPSVPVQRHPIDHGDDVYPVWWPGPHWLGIATEGMLIARRAVTSEDRKQFRTVRPQMGTPKGDHVHHVLPLSLGGKNEKPNFEILKGDKHMGWHRTFRISQEHARHDTGEVERINPEQTSETGKKFIIYTDDAKKEEAKKPIKK